MQFSWYIMYSKLTNGLEKCCLEQFSTCVFSVSPLLDFTGNQILLSLDQCPIMTNTFQQTFPWNATDKIHRVPPGWPFKYTRVVVFIWIQYKNLNNTRRKILFLIVWKFIFTQKLQLTLVAFDSPWLTSNHCERRSLASHCNHDKVHTNHWNSSSH